MKDQLDIDVEYEEILADYYEQYGDEEYGAEDDFDIDDEYPRSEERDTLERAIDFFCDADLRKKTAVYYGAEPDADIVTIEQMRLMCDVLKVVEDFERMLKAPLPPPEGYATCCVCGEYTPNTSAKCQYCGQQYSPF